MQVKQIYELVNLTTKEVLGESAVVNEDLSNLVDIGTAVFNAEAVENYTKKLIDRIGKMVFVNRPYTGRVPSVLMDSWEFGSVLEKIRAEMPDASENESWELEDGTSYDPNIFYKPRISAKFFNSKTTFEVDMSFTNKQVKSAFINATQMNAFMSMIYTAIENSMTVKFDALVMRTINNMIGETMYDAFPAGTYTGTAVRAVNLLKKYNDQFDPDTDLTADEALTNPDFLRYAAYVMGYTADDMSNLSTLFNIGATEKFTPKDRLHWVLHSRFARAADVYLQSDTFHNEFTKLPEAELISYWQGSGTSFDEDDTMSIKIKTASGNTLTLSGIIGVMFDRDALGVTNIDSRVTTQYNAKAEFTNSFFKRDAGYFNDKDENFVVFFMA